jgi:hypothetical protein
MRYFKYNDQDGDKFVSEQDILETYYSYWKEQMIKVGKENLISPELCIEDFIVVHWAREIK